MRRRIVGLMGVFIVVGVMASPLAAQVKTKAVAHDLEGKDNCLMCHTPGLMEPVPDTPESHEGRAIESCLWCHAPDSPMVTTGPKLISHDLEGKDNCLMCHTPGVMEPVPDTPENHEGRGIEVCLWCHTKAG